MEEQATPDTAAPQRGQARELHIIPVLNGWIVHAGCQTVVFTSATVLAEQLKAYYADPLAVERLYLQKAVNLVEGAGALLRRNPPTPANTVAAAR